MDPSTRFQDDEIRRILARAAERQEQADRALPAADAGSAAGQEPGLSLVELQAVAREVGIAPAHVQAAARELQLRGEGAGARYPFLGVPKETVDHRVVPGTLTDREWERIVEGVRAEFRVPGITNAFGDVREWWSSSLSMTGGVRLRIEPGDDGTEVTLRRSNAHMSQLTHALGWTFGGMAGVFATIVALGALEPGAIAAPILFGAVSAATFVGARLLSRAAARKERGRFARILDRIELIARSAESE